MRRRTATAVVVIASLAAVAAARYHMATREDRDKETFREVFMVPPGRVLRQLDLGFHSMTADLMFIRANLYYGQHILTDEQLPWLDNFNDVLLDLDPAFKKAYFWAAMVTIYRQRSFDYAPDPHVERANRILERGMLNFPDDHRFPMRIGFNLYYELGRIQASIPYLERASRIPGSPDWLRFKLVDLYTKNEIQKALAVDILKEMLIEEDNPQLNEALRARLQRVMDDRERESFIQERTEMIAGWQRDFGYLPINLYLLIRETEDNHDP